MEEEGIDVDTIDYRRDQWTLLCAEVGALQAAVKASAEAEEEEVEGVVVGDGTEQVCGNFCYIIQFTCI